MLLLQAWLLGCAPKDQPEEHAQLNDFRPYGPQHATLAFEREGTSRGTEMFWIDSFGRLERHSIDVEQITDKGFRGSKTLGIKHGPEVTIVDSGAHKAFRFTEPVLDSLYHLPAGSIPTPEAQFKSFFTRLDYQMVGDTTLPVGLHAHIWKQQGTANTLLEWKAMIVGKRTQGQSGFDELVLRSIDTTSPVSPSLFEIPPNLPIQNGLPHP